MVLRDDKGHVVFAASKLEHMITYPFEIELRAILKGLQLCILMGSTYLQLESDSLLVVQELNMDGPSLSI